MSLIPTDLFFPLDPDQIAATQLINTRKHLWIHGADEHKRAELLTHVVLQNLYEGKTCLINVPAEIEAIVRNVLNQLNLSHLVFHLGSGVDREVIASMQLARKKSTTGDNQERAELACEKYNHWLDQIERSYHEMSREVFGDMSWKMVLDKTLQRNRDSYKSLLDAALSAREFSMSQQEYWHIKGRIRTFQRLRVLRSPSFDLMDSLADEPFTNPDGRAAKRQIFESLDSIVTGGRVLLRSIGEAIQAYRRATTGKHHQEIKELRDMISHLQDLIEKGKVRYGNDILIESTFNEIAGRLKRSFSQKFTELHDLRHDLRTGFIEIQEKYTRLNPNNTVTSRNDNEPVLLENLPERLTAMSDEMETWGHEIEQRATSHKRRLNARNISSDAPLRDTIQHIESEIARYIEWLNNTGALKENFEINALSLEKSSIKIKNIVLLCTKMKEALSDFEAYYLWRSFWSQLDDNTRAILESLDLMEDHAQVDAFDAWYFDNILDQTQESEMHDRLPRHTEFMNKIADTRAVVTETIRNACQNTRHEILKELRNKNKKLVSGITQANAVVLTEELKVLPAQVLSRLFPVVFCSQVHLRDYAYYFDNLVVWNQNGTDFKAACAQAQKCILFSSAAITDTDVNDNIYSFKRLRINSAREPRKLLTLTASDKLRVATRLSSLLMPFVHEMRAYNARHVQILSFMGELSDKHLLSLLEMPYKPIGEDGTISSEQVTEALLDTAKPTVLLTRDGILGYNYSGAMLWQMEILRFFRDSGIPVINSWSANWKEDSHTELRMMADSLLEISRSTEEPRFEPVAKPQNAISA